MKISLDKEYETRTGKPVEIIMVEQNFSTTDKSVLGMITEEDGSKSVTFWFDSGAYYPGVATSSHDLFLKRKVRPYTTKQLVDHIGDYILSKNNEQYQIVELVTAVKNIKDDELITLIRVAKVGKSTTSETVYMADLEVGTDNVRFDPQEFADAFRWVDGSPCGNK